MHTFALYVLRDPRDGRIRYAGVTRTSLAQRLRDHIASARRATSETANHRAWWIKDVLLTGLRPTIEFAQSTTTDTWREDERALIAQLRAEGCDLTNGDDGGWPVTDASWSSTASQRRQATIRQRRTLPDGSLRPYFTDEVLQRMRERETGKTLSPETRAKVSAARTGQKRDPEVVERAASKLRGKKQSPELIAKRVAARKASGAWFPNGVKRKQPQP